MGQHKPDNQIFIKLKVFNKSGAETRQ